MTASNEPGATQQAEEYDTGRAILLAAVAALGGFLFGFDTAVINGAVTAITEDFQMGPFLPGFAVASALLGCAVGGLVRRAASPTAGPHPRDGDRRGAVRRQRDRLRAGVLAVGPHHLADRRRAGHRRRLA